MTDIPGDYQYRALYHGNPVQRLWHKAKLELIREVALPEPGERVLDAACGSGVISDFLASNGANVTGVDLNPDAINFAKRQFERPGIRFECASLFEFTGGPFDRIYCLEAIEHFPETEISGLLTRFSRLATPGARLFVTTPNYASLWPLIEWILDTFKLTPRLKDEQHLSKMTPFLLEKDRISGASGQTHPPCRDRRRGLGEFIQNRQPSLRCPQKQESRRQGHQSLRR